MESPVLTSTLFLTLLLGIGLFFFIRASTKDRTEVLTLGSEQSEDRLLEQLQAYFDQRAYRVLSLDEEHRQLTLQGHVRASLALAIFLSLLAAIGLGCLALVLTILLPDGGLWWRGLVLISPLAGWFYWRGANRDEQVSLTLVTPLEITPPIQSLIVVNGHRDELAALQQQLQLKDCS